MTSHGPRESDHEPPASGGGTPTPRDRRRRTHLLIVGPDPFAPGDADRLLAPPVRAANLFEAIGSVGSAHAGTPIGAVLVRNELIPSTTSHVAAAIRRLDPSITLIRIVDGTGDDPLPGVRGFDHVLRAPIDPAELAARLGPGWLEVDEREHVSDADPFSAPPAEASTDSRVLPPAVPATTAHTAPVRTPNPTTSPAPSSSRIADADDLGDTDLLHAVMNDPRGVRESAVALIRQQSGWSDLRFIEPESAGATRQAERGARADVRVDDQLAGALMSDRASAADLASWARWLARWLALDAAYRDYRLLAFRDDLTGAWNRRYLDRFLVDTLAEAHRRRRPVSVMVFDIDDFKQYNDAYGHEAGDVILRETVALLNSVIRSCDRVCRVGGDEFAVIFADLEAPRESGSMHPDSVEAIARRFQEQVCTMRFPKLGLEAPGTLSISGGLATYPWDGTDPATLLNLADHRALESKRRGKNHLTFGAEGARMPRHDDPTAPPEPAP